MRPASSGSAASSSSQVHASIARGYRPRGTIFARGAGQCGSAGAFDDAVVAEVGEQGAGTTAESKTLPVGHRDRDVLDRVRVDRERDPTEVVQILDADPVELGVAAEQREQLELTRGALHLPVEL